jgi:hypothetical protein
MQIHVPPSDMRRCFKELLRSGIGCDITFQVGDEKVCAHKLVLAAHSPVFKAQFFGPIGKPDLCTVVVEDVEPIVFKVMVVCGSHHFLDCIFFCFMPFSPLHPNIGKHKHYVANLQDYFSYIYHSPFFCEILFKLRKLAYWEHFSC